MSNPLDGTLVVNLAVNLPGPLAAARFASMGARIVKVEPPTGDPLQAVAPDWYESLTRGQETVVLDLKQEGERTRMHDLLESADLLITAMRPGALSRLGLKDLPSAHPRLGHIEIVGFDGPREEEPGHDLNYQAAHGTLSPPTMPTVPVADMLGAERAVSEGLLLLMERSRTGLGARRRVVLDEAAADAGAAVRYGLMGRSAPLGGGIATYGLYPTLDGCLALGALEPHFAARIADALGISPTHESLAAAFAARPTVHWESLAEREDIPITAVR